MTLLLSEVIMPSLKALDINDSRLDSNRGSLRALAVRCIALHASLSKNGIREHRSFFLAVLQKYGAAAAMYNSRNDADSEAHAVAESALLFLTDSTLMHHCSSTLEDTDVRLQWTCELFKVL